MLYAGCDLGAVAAKVVIINNDGVFAYDTLSYKNLPKQAANTVMQNALSRADLSLDQICCCMATGFGRKVIPFADMDAPELVCLSRGIQLINPEVRTVIDAGGQKLRAFNIGDNGKVTDSTTNEKCASGTGKFIEVMAKSLELSLDRLSLLPLDSKNPVSITSQCGVFAESEVLTHINEGNDRADIVAGISRSVAGRISSMARKISLTEPVTMVGGVAKNFGVVHYTQKELGLEFVEPGTDPQIVTALGAALLARERYSAAS